MDSKMQEAPERVWVAKMFYRTSERGSASLNESARHSVPYVREDVHAAALSEAQSHIKRLEAALDECEHATATIVRLEAQLNTLRLAFHVGAAETIAENEDTIARLEAALREIAEDVGNLGDDLTYLPDATRFNLHENAYNIGKAAFAALSPREGEGT